MSKNGFSLLELIIASAILAVGITVVLQALSYSARIAGLSNDMAKAVFLAKDKMQELEFREAQGNLSAAPYDSGKQDKFNWEYTNTLDTDLELYRLDFDVTWQRKDRDEKISLNTYFRQ